jgi:hypothetical protein
MGIASKPILATGQQSVVTNDIFTPVGSHIAGTDISSATVIMPGNMGVTGQADKVVIQTTAQNIRYTLDGTTPTPTVGFQLKSTDPPRQIIIRPETGGVVLTVIEEAGGAVLQVQFGV